MLFIFSMLNILSAQTSMADSIFHKDNGEKIYHSNFVDTVASFPGGDKKFFDYLSKNIRHPSHANGGTVYASFVVEKDGTITDIIIIIGLNDTFNNEVLRLISTFPKWKPAIKGGQPVRSQYNLPIKFTNK